MKIKIFTVVLAVLVLVFLVTACSPGTTATTTTAPSNNTTTLDGAALFQERCSVCHRLPTSARGTADQWKTVVDSMVARGAKLTPEEQTAVIDYLAANLGK
jgi:mono/diheme cytochrome c family protein